MKRVVTFAMMTMTALAATAADVYSFTMALSVPRVFDNADSLGKRVYQTQRIVGEMVVAYGGDGEPAIILRNLTNLTHRVGGECVTYDSSAAEAVRWHYIGNNRTGCFPVPSVSMEAVLQPSYAAGYEVDEDNSLLITLAGRGNSARICGGRKPCVVRGLVSGTIGCGCRAYGHTSPTRVIGECGPLLDSVVDVAAVFGTWQIKFKRCE